MNYHSAKKFYSTTSTSRLTTLNSNVEHTAVNNSKYTTILPLASGNTDQDSDREFIPGNLDNENAFWTAGRTGSWYCKY